MGFRFCWMELGLLVSLSRVGVAFGAFSLKLATQLLTCIPHAIMVNLSPFMILYPA